MRHIIFYFLECQPILIGFYIENRFSSETDNYYAKKINSNEVKEIRYGKDIYRL
jgi:hypothetical protein